MSAFSVAALVAACGPSVSAPPDGALTADSRPALPSADAPPPPDNTAVYAHSPTELYRVDPETLAVAVVAPFSFDGNRVNITDIAINEAGVMLGISLGAIFAIDEQSGAATHLTDTASGFTSLSYVPDPSDPAREILIAADFDGDVFEIDPDTGASTLRGTYGIDNQGNAIGSSGDIVSVRGFGTVATVNVAGSSNDFLAWLNPATFDASLIGDTGYDRIFGLGFWKGTVYGFTDNMEMVSIDVNNGARTELITAGAIRWWGAGVTTIAPIID